MKKKLTSYLEYKIYFNCIFLRIYDTPAPKNKKGLLQLMSTPSTEPSRIEIWKMFNAIAKSYDRVNRCMTMGLDLYWRRKVASFFPRSKNLHVLDCATGTGDQLLSLLSCVPSIENITGIDLAEEMLAIGQKKVDKHPLSHKAKLLRACALSLPFSPESFDCITLSFGIRNVTQVKDCLHELLRVLKPGGKLLILETSLPQNKLLRFMHLSYIRKVLPSIGGWISKRTDAYTYLNKTAETFPCGKAFCELLLQAGFENPKAHPLTFGAVSIYVADKHIPL